MTRRDDNASVYLTPEFRGSVLSFPVRIFIIQCIALRQEENNPAAYSFVNFNHELFLSVILIFKYLLFIIFLALIPNLISLWLQNMDYILKCNV